MAQCVTGGSGRDNSVTAMLEILGWQSLGSRRRESRIVLLYKGVHGFVTVPHEGHIEKHQGKTIANNT